MAPPVVGCTPASAASRSPTKSPPWSRAIGWHVQSKLRQRIARRPPKGLAIWVSLFVVVGRIARPDCKYREQTSRNGIRATNLVVRSESEKDRRHHRRQFRSAPGDKGPSLSIRIYHLHFRFGRGVPPRRQGEQGGLPCRRRRPRRYFRH